MPIYKNKQGNPVLWSKRFFLELFSIEGDVGGRHLLSQYADVVVQCPVDSNAIHRDIDNENQLALMEKSMRKTETG